MANLTRFGNFDSLFDEFAKGFWVKPLAMPAGEVLKLKVDVKEDDKATVAKYQDGVLDLTLPKKAGNGSRRISVQ